MADPDVGGPNGGSGTTHDVPAEAAQAVARGARTVVLVEGPSDRAALEELAARRGLDLAAAHVAVVAIGGAGNFARYLRVCGPHGLQLAVAGLCDSGEIDDVRRGLAHAGLASDADVATMAGLGFHVCIEDLEDELIRALGPAEVEEVIAAQGDLRSLRTFRQQPAQRDRSTTRQLRRFMGTTSGRKIAYARRLVAALDPTQVPRPLEGVLSHVMGAGPPAG